MASLCCRSQLQAFAHESLWASDAQAKLLGCSVQRSFSMRSALAALLVVASIPAAFAQAKPLSQVLGAACYGRVYDKAHLAAHPRQRVTSIIVRDGVVPVGKQPGVVAIVDIRLTLRGGETAEASGYCKRAGANLICGLEGDAGSVTISRRGRDGVLVAVNSRFDIETNKGFIELAKGDDRAFQLASWSDCGK
jgi:hypothetical protein